MHPSLLRDLMANALLFRDNQIISFSLHLCINMLSAFTWSIMINFYSTVEKWYNFWQIWPIFLTISVKKLKNQFNCYLQSGFLKSLETEIFRQYLMLSNREALDSLWIWSNYHKRNRLFTRFFSLSFPKSIFIVLLYTCLKTW